MTLANPKDQKAQAINLGFSLSYPYPKYLLAEMVKVRLPSPTAFPDFSPFEQEETSQQPLMFL